MAGEFGWRVWLARRKSEHIRLFLRGIEKSALTRDMQIGGLGMLVCFAIWTRWQLVTYCVDVLLGMRGEIGQV